MKSVKFWLALAVAALLSNAHIAHSQDVDSLFNEGKLLMTGGVSDVEGAGGGGLVPWALITGYGTDDGIGMNAHYTVLPMSDFDFQSAGIAIGMYDRLEISLAKQSFDTRSAGAKLGLGKSFTFYQDIVGAKVRLFGDAVYDQDNWIPQVSFGTEYKSNDRNAVIHAIGGTSDHGIDYYLATSKLFLNQSLLVNATVRETKANQFGILGFGGDKDNDYSTQYEGSVAYLLNRQWAIGGEYRTRPDNLKFAREQDAKDLFTAYFFNKNLSATLAFVDLGDVATQTGQHGIYLSLQAGF
jgi:hypothetical protein